jgi:hypothetical protein
MNCTSTPSVCTRTTPDQRRDLRKQVEGVGTRLACCGSSNTIPVRAGETTSPTYGAASGLADVLFVAPFTPTVPGTERYPDGLR